MLVGPLGPDAIEDETRATAEDASSGPEHHDEEDVEQ
jgi:hypothetical protein